MRHGASVLGIKHPHEPFYDALRLSDSQRQSLLAFLNSRRTAMPGPGQRGDERVDFAVKGLMIQMRHPGGSSINYVVRPRNLSASGVGFLHGSFCYTGTPVELSLRSIDGERTAIYGHVVRCNHLQGLVHEVGVKFQEPIDPDRYIRSFVNSAGGASPAKRLPRLQGRLLYVEDIVDDQELLKFQLKPMGVEVVAQPDPRAVVEHLAEERFDMLIMGLWLPGVDGAALLEEIRQNHPSLPIMILTADHTDPSLTQARESGANAVMTKPYCLEELSDVLSEHLLAAPDPQADPLVSDHWPNVRMRPLILNYLERLEEQVDHLAELIRESDQQAELAKQAARMRGSAGGYGYPQISEAAARLHAAALADEADPDEMRSRFVELTRLCSAACQLRPARPNPVPGTEAPAADPPA